MQCSFKCFTFSFIAKTLWLNILFLNESILYAFVVAVITWCLCFFSFYIQELEKSKPVILTGDLNCAHQEIDIYNPAVSFPYFVVNKPFRLPNWSLNGRKSVPVVLIGPRLRTLRILISQAFPAHFVNSQTLFTFYMQCVTCTY